MGSPIKREWVSKDGRVRLIQGDCLEVMPLLGKVDCVVSSPPYNTLPTSHKPSGLHADRKTGVNKWIDKAANGYFDSRDEEEYQKWLLGVFGECFLMCTGIMWINHKIRCRDGVAIHPARIFPWPIYSEVIWDRAVSMALNCKRYAPSTEHLLGFGKPVVWNDHLNGLMSVWRIRYDLDNNDHPCAFPLAIAQRPIESSTNPNDTIFDPFMGSGTTGIACIRTGRRFIGVEIDAHYFDVARDRIIRELALPRLFKPEQNLQEHKMKPLI